MRGSVRWRAGAWRIRVDLGRDPVTGRRRQVERTVRAPNTRAGRRQADDELARLIVEARAGAIAAGPSMTVAELLERWVRDREPAWGPSGAESTRARIARHIAPHLGGKRADRLRPADIVHWHDRLRAAGLAEATVARTHAIIQAALQWAVDLELLDRNVAARRRPRVPQRPRQDPGDDVMVALLRAAEGDLAAFLRLAAVTGARRGHLVALRWGDIDLDAGTITFTRALAKVRGGTIEKAGKAGVAYQLALDGGTVDVLRAHRRRCAERALAVGVALDETSWVFARDPAASKPWHPDGVNQRFARLRKQVPGAENVTPHQFRHWMATVMFEAGFDPLTVAGRGGWTSPAVPLTTYGHRRRPRDEAAAATLAERLDAEA